MDLAEFIKPKFTIVNGGIDLRERFKERSQWPFGRPSVEGGVHDVGGALDQYGSDALAGNRNARREAFLALRK